MKIGNKNFAERLVIFSTFFIVKIKRSFSRNFLHCWFYKYERIKEIYIQNDENGRSRRFHRLALKMCFAKRKGKHEKERRCVQGNKKKEVDVVIIYIWNIYSSQGKRLKLNSAFVYLSCRRVLG
jgi:hypothetical protein